MELKDKVVVITGGSRGFGKALAEAFLTEGAKISICGLNESELNKTAADLGVLGMVADVRDEGEMQKLADKTIEKYGALDIWINNAGLWMPYRNAEDFDMDKVKEMFDINVIGLMNGSRVALQHMKEKNEGTIINVLSSAALSGRPKSSTYSASKWAGRGFTQGIREENKETNLKILAIYPGGMKTDMIIKHPEFDKFMEVEYAAGKVIENLKLENPDPELIIKRPNA